MRFKTEQEGHQNLMGKRIPDPSFLKGRVNPKRDELPKIKQNSIKDLEQAFDEWLEAKRLMFSPEEQIALMGVDHRGRRGQKNQAYRDKIVNVFVAWTEGKPLREELVAAGPLKGIK